MIPFIVVVASSFKDQLEETKKILKNILKDQEILKALNQEFPFNHPDIMVFQSEKSYGINLVRNLKKILSRKPYQARERLVLIPEAEKLTIEAQNALLKTLEEPPINTFLVLTVSRQEALLPTILSRSQVIRRTKILKLEEDSRKVYFSLLKKILKASPGERLLLAEPFCQSREEAINFCREFLVFWHEILVSGDHHLKENQIKKALENTQKARILLEKNINSRLVIENLFLSLPIAN